MTKAIAGLLWALLALGVILVVVMTWHPWVTPWTGVHR